MKVGIILQSSNPEHIWNAFRFGITALKAGHRVETFLLSEGSELDKIPDTEDFDISIKIVEYKMLKGKILACGTCLKLHGMEEGGKCFASTMVDLLILIETADKVVTF